MDNFPRTEDTYTYVDTFERKHKSKLEFAYHSIKLHIKYKVLVILTKRTVRLECSFKDVGQILFIGKPRWKKIK